MSTRRRHRKSSRSRRKAGKTRQLLMSVVIAGACLGGVLFAVGEFAGNPTLKHLSFMYLLAVAVVFCVWRALATAAAAEDEGES